MSITRVAAHPADGVVDVVLLIYPPCLPPSSSPSSPVELIMSTRRRSQRAGWADDAESDRSLSLMVIMPPLFLSHSSTVTCQNEGGAASRERKCKLVRHYGSTSQFLSFFFPSSSRSTSWLNLNISYDGQNESILPPHPIYILACIVLTSFPTRSKSTADLKWEKKSFSLDCFEQLEFVCRRAVAAQSLFFLNRSPPPTASY